jgi:hypothetical protein
MRTRIRNSLIDVTAVLVLIAATAVVTALICHF